MTRKLIQFSKAFIPCAIISSVAIVFGIVGLFVRGINFGLDYQPGLLEEVRIAPAVLDVTYSGASNVTLDMTSTQIDIVISGTGAENETRTFSFVAYQTVAELAAGLNAIDGVSATVNSHGDALSSELFANSAAANRLSQTPYRLYAAGKMMADVSAVRDVFASLEGVSVQQLGSGDSMSFQIRMADKSDGTSSADLQNIILTMLENAFGKDNVAVVRTDFIGSSFLVLLQCNQLFCLLQL